MPAVARIIAPHEELEISSSKSFTVRAFGTMPLEVACNNKTCLNEWWLDCPKRLACSVRNSEIAPKSIFLFLCNGAHKTDCRSFVHNL
ncbi:hypothetical protein PRUPE_3G047700 [Prunus persica]|uniref:Uncharacterized protein n=1 Tax=Prunus persica TaxID=3760 RepID=M5XA53_PRUPE|nr:hypothetical protein PRUPE_3G047700 [Prunus persica]